MDKISLGDIYKFRTGEIGMVINEKPDYYSVLCEDGKISNVRKGIPYTFVDLDNDTSSIYKEYKDYLFEKASILKRIELENEKLSVEGMDLKLINLIQDKKEVQISGKINGIFYQESKKTGLLKKK